MLIFLLFLFVPAASFSPWKVHSWGCSTCLDKTTQAEDGLCDTGPSFVMHQSDKEECWKTAFQGFQNLVETNQF